ncbi:MAG: hypothetical protein H7257_10205 [Taibaiella sp.]|nr:hypothetical protein [Taibaiella sp.]
MPDDKYFISHAVKAKIQRNYHLTLGEDWHHYSVPFSFIGKTVSVIYDTDIVEIYHDHKRIALHIRSFKPHAFTSIKEHMPESHQRYAEQQGWTAEYFLEQAIKIGSATHLYMEGVLKSKKYRNKLITPALVSSGW